MIVTVHFIYLDDRILELEGNLEITYAQLYCAGGKTKTPNYLRSRAVLILIVGFLVLWLP